MWYMKILSVIKYAIDHYLSKKENIISKERLYIKSHGKYTSQEKTTRIAHTHAVCHQKREQLQNSVRSSKTKQ